MAEYHFTIKFDRRLFIILAIFAISGIFVFGALLYLFLIYVPIDILKLQITIKDQMFKAKLEGYLPVHAEINENITVPVKGIFPITALFNQDIVLPFDQNLTVPVDIDAPVPLDLVVRFKTSIPVNTSVPIDTVVQAKILGVSVSVPVKGELPLNMMIPVEQDVPINETFRLKLITPVKVHIKEIFRVPVRTTISTDIPLDHNVTVPIKTSIDAKASIEGEIPGLRLLENKIDIGIDQLDIVRKKSP
ncbi:MAG TPA: hypothetical protein VII00_02275 [bacterium]